MAKEKEKKQYEMPGTEIVEKELNREKYRKRYMSVMRSTVYVLIIVASVAVLVATLWLPVLQIYGSSMNPTLFDGDIMLSLKGSNYQIGDVVAFYYNNKILVKRVIASSGQWVDIDKSGQVYVDGEPIDEPYVSDLALGECDIRLPYQVPDTRVFVMGDHRNVSIDSRTKAVGCIADEQIVGKLVYRIWPLKDFGAVQNIKYDNKTETTTQPAQ